MGVKLSERGARTDESLEVMIKLWRGEAVSHHGRFHQFDDIYMTPAPRQQPHPAAVGRRHVVADAASHRALV